MSTSAATESPAAAHHRLDRPLPTATRPASLTRIALPCAASATVILTGIHACLGGPLARMAAEIVFTTLTRRLADPHVTVDPPRYRADVFRSLEELSITAAIQPVG
jgi:cytochrome P450